LIRGHCFFLFASFVPFCGYSFFVLAFAALADVAKGGDGAKSALREFYSSSYRSRYSFISRTGVVEYGRDEFIRAPKLCVLCVFVVKFFFYFRSPFTDADFAHDSQDGMVWLIF
jgi:hypothetical protein